MTASPAAFDATFADWKLVKSRKVVQIVLEIPMEQSDLAYQVLGGMPNHAAEAWVAVARLSAGSSNGRTADFESANEGSTPSPATKARKRWSELPLSQQAAMRCNQKAFQEFCECPDKEWVEQHVRTVCGVSSRRELNTNEAAARKWRALDQEYELWLMAGA
jgi:hypothetical protein